MKVIKYLYEKILEEVDDADKYINHAMRYKEEYPELSRVLSNLSLQELEHSQMLHTEVVNIIRKYRDEHGDPPEAMMAVYDYLHEQEIEKYNSVKMKQEKYRTS